ncbi:MAG: DUF2269 family protein [Anaeromyxobacteraceae bacterium]
MSPFTIVVFLHILGATALVGHGLASPLVHAAVKRAPTVEALLPWLGFARDSAKLNPLASLVVLATGLWLAEGRWGEGWLEVSAALFVASAVIAMAIVARAGKQLAAAAVAAPRGPIPPALDALRHAAPWNRGADALLANGIATLFLMVNQPGLLVSVLVAAGAHGAVLAVRAVAGRKVGVAVAREA